jgi:hypothetical protein
MSGSRILFQGTGNCIVQGMTFDTNSNLYVVGSFITTQNIPLYNLDGTLSNIEIPITTSSSNKTNMFLIKYNSIGNVVGRSILYNEGTNPQFNNINVVVDSLGNIYVAGTARNDTNNMLINDIAQTNVSINNLLLLRYSSNTFGFVIKWNSQGIATNRARVFNSSVSNSSSRINDIKVNNFGEVYVTGRRFVADTNNFRIENLDGTITNYSGNTLNKQAFTIKWSASGEFLEQYEIWVEGRTDAQGQTISIDNQDNAYISGRYSSSSSRPIRKNGSTIDVSLPSTSDNDVFMMIWSKDGDFIGQTTLKGTGSDIGYSIATDSLRNIYLTGEYNSTSNVSINQIINTSDATSASVTLLRGNGTNKFIIKWDNSGNYVAHSILYGTGTDIGNSIAIDNNDNVYVTGIYENPNEALTIHNIKSSLTQSAYTLPSSLNIDSFLIKWNSNGDLDSFTSLQGTGNDVGNIVCVDRNTNNVFFGGSYVSNTFVNVYNLELENDFSQREIQYSLLASSIQSPFVIGYNSVGKEIINVIIEIKSNIETKILNLNNPENNTITTTLFTETERNEIKNLDINTRNEIRTFIANEIFIRFDDLEKVITTPENIIFETISETNIITSVVIINPNRINSINVNELMRNINTGIYIPINTTFTINLGSEVLFITEDLETNTYDISGSVTLNAIKGIKYEIFDYVFVFGSMSIYPNITNSFSSIHLQTNNIQTTNINASNITCNNLQIEEHGTVKFLQKELQISKINNLENIEPFDSVINNGNLDLCNNSILNVTKISNQTNNIIIEPFNSNTLVINGNLDMCNNSITGVNEINNAIFFDTNGSITFEKTVVNGNIEFIGSNREIQNIESITNDDKLIIEPTNKLIIDGNIDLSFNGNITNVNSIAANELIINNTEKIDISENNTNAHFFPIFTRNYGSNQTLFNNNKLKYNPNNNVLSVDNINIEKQQFIPFVKNLGIISNSSFTIEPLNSGFSSRSNIIYGTADVSSNSTIIIPLSTKILNDISYGINDFKLFATSRNNTFNIINATTRPFNKTEDTTVSFDIKLSSRTGEQTNSSITINYIVFHTVNNE